MAFAPALGLLGAGVSAFGAIEGGIAQKNMYNYQAEIASNNAITANQNATYAAHAGLTQSTNTSLKAAEKQAKIKDALAANNVDVHSGSAANVEESAREEGKLETQETNANAQAQVYGYRVQQESFVSQENLDKAAAANAVPASLLTAGGGLLSSASAIGMKSPTFFNDIGNLFTSS